MESSDVQPLEHARNPCLHIFGMVVGTHSSSGLAVGSRGGLGRQRHAQSRYLWVPPRKQEGDLRLKMEAGDTNLRDALTKLLDDRRMAEFLTSTVYEFTDRRPSIVQETRSRTTSLTVRKSAVFSR